MPRVVYPFKKAPNDPSFLTQVAKKGRADVWTARNPLIGGRLGFKLRYLPAKAGEFDNDHCLGIIEMRVGSFVDVCTEFFADLERSMVYMERMPDGGDAG